MKCFMYPDISMKRINRCNRCHLCPYVACSSSCNDRSELLQKLTGLRPSHLLPILCDKNIGRLGLEICLRKDVNKEQRTGLLISVIIFARKNCLRRCYIIF